MEDQGADFWINQQYAADTARTVGGGFAFSRADGSLASGGHSRPAGLPTGPWADKRTTVHFTGDAVSTWDTLRYEVGCTPGESVATGCPPSATTSAASGTTAAQPPGTSATTPVWFPPGRWTDYFTGRTYTGPGTAEVTTGLASMPVFTRAGAIVPRRGRYPGAVDRRTWTVRIHDVGAAPARVTVNGAPAAGTFDAASRTLTVRSPALPVTSQVTVSLR